MPSFSDPRADAGGPRPLPFVEFLDLLRAKGLGVGLHEYLAAGKLMSRWDGVARDEFRDAVAALIGRHEGEVQAIRNLFDEVYPREQPPTTAPPPAAIAQLSTLIGMLTSRLTWVAIIGVLALASVAAFMVGYYRTVPLPALPPAPILVAAGPLPPAPPRPESTVSAADASRLADTLIRAPGPPPSDLGTPQSHVDWRLMRALSLAVWMVTLGAFWGARMRASARIWT